MRKKRQRRTNSPPPRSGEVLDVRAAAALLTVSTDTVYDLLNQGELPGRKVGRKWITTRSALLRWIEGSGEQQRLARAIERGGRDALVTALKTGTARVKKGAS